MPLTFVYGDIFAQPADVFVNPVNVVGVMGKGLAAVFKSRYPDMFVAYKAACNDGDLRIGTLHLYDNSTPMVLNFPTKKHWRGKSTIDIINIGLDVFVNDYAGSRITGTVAFPKLGAGLGGLDWEIDVRPLMVAKLQHVPLNVLIVV